MRNRATRAVASEGADSSKSLQRQEEPLQDQQQQQQQQQHQQQQQQQQQQQHFASAHLKLYTRVQHRLRQQLLDDHIPDLVLGLDAQRRELYDLVSRTLSTGEGNSTLLVGPRGSGKSLTTELVLRQLREERGATAFRVVRLNGLLQVNDSAALREIARQLCVDDAVLGTRRRRRRLKQEVSGSVPGAPTGGCNAVCSGDVDDDDNDNDDVDDDDDDDDGPTPNADGAGDGGAGEVRFGSFAETLAMIVESLVSGGRDAVPLLFLLDEFEQFALASTIGAALGGGRELVKQLLLYNLFDAAQMYDVPICVVGITCRLDAVELLEKRVKSRFSHRQIQFFSSHSFGDYMRLFGAALKLPRDWDWEQTDGGGGGGGGGGSGGGPNKRRRVGEGKGRERGIASASASASNGNGNGNGGFEVAAWNAHVDALVEVEELRRLFRLVFDRHRSVRTLHRLLFPAVCGLSSERPRLTAEALKAVLESQSKDAKGLVVAGLSVSELCLVISMHKLEERYEQEPFNFAMVYAEWQSFWKQHSLMTSQLASKEAAFKAFERLQRLELVAAVGAASCGAPREFQLAKLMLEPEQVLDAVSRFRRLPEAIRKWALADVSLNTT